MDILENYLDKIQQEFFVQSVAITNINGDFKNAWTECYNSRCADNENNYDRRYCKTNCEIIACQRAIASLNSQLPNCSGAKQSGRCIESIKNNIQKYRDKIQRARDTQDEISSKRAEYNRKVS